MKLKSLAAACALAVLGTGQAYALYDTPSSGNGPLIFTAWLPTASGGQSFVTGLSLSLNDFLPTVNHPAMSFDLTKDATFTSLFLPQGTTSLSSSLLWTVSAADSTTPPVNTGFRFEYTSSNVAFSPTNLQISNAAKDAQTFISQQNAAQTLSPNPCPGVSGNAGSCGSSVASDNRNANASAAKWGANYGLAGVYNGAAHPDQSLLFYSSFAGGTSSGPNQTVEFFQNSAQTVGSTWKLSSDGTLTWSGSQIAAVPEPSTLAALAAGLVGLLGIARRRLSA